LIRDVYDKCAEFLGSGHPYTRVAAHNMGTAHDQTAEPAFDAWKEIDVDIPDT
jgi:hypothetical protein